MSTQTKGDLYCNFKWLHKLVRFSETISKSNGTKVKVILLSRHRGFRADLRTSKTKFKKISAEHLNATKNYVWNVCEKKESVTEHEVVYHILFVNHRVSALDMIRYMNIMIRQVINYQFPKKYPGAMDRLYNEERAETLLTKWTLDLANSFDEEYMESQYEPKEIK